MDVVDIIFVEEEIPGPSMHLTRWWDGDMRQIENWKMASNDVEVDKNMGFDQFVQSLSSCFQELLKWSSISGPFLSQNLSPNEPTKITTIVVDLDCVYPQWLGLGANHPNPTVERIKTKWMMPVSGRFGSLHLRAWFKRLQKLELNRIYCIIINIKFSRKTQVLSKTITGETEIRKHDLYGVETQILDKTSILLLPFYLALYKSSIF